MLKPKVEVREEAGVLVAEFFDCLRLDPAPVQDLQARYDAHQRSGGRSVLVVDLNGVAFAGSAVLGGFMAIQRSNRPAGGRLIFCNVDPNVFEVFRVARLDSLFTFAADKAAALALATSGSAPPAPTTPAPTGAGPLRKSKRRTP